MRKENITLDVKLIWLKFRRGIKWLFKGFLLNISVILLLFSAAVSLLMLIPNCLHREPVYSYFISELKLPLSYDLSGKVQILDVDNNLVNKDVEIYIGGYSSMAKFDGTFSLKFTSSETIKVPIVINYTKPNGQSETQIEFIALRCGEYHLQKEFIYHV